MTRKSTTHVVEMNAAALVTTSIGLGVAVAMGIVSRKRMDILDRFDKSEQFSKRVNDICMRQMMVNIATAGRPQRVSARVEFEALLDRIIAMADAS